MAVLQRRFGSEKGSVALWSKAIVGSLSGTLNLVCISYSANG
jgi:hypothetical protein